MKRYLVPAVLTLVLLSGCVSAGILDLTPTDPRLDKKVTLEVNHVKLEEVAESLSEQTGITIQAGTGKRDWKPRERRVTISARDIPVGKMMDDISLLLGFHISREGKQDEWTYIIWQDKKGRELEAEMLIAQQEAEAQRAMKTRQAMTDLASKALTMTPEEAMKFREKDPSLAYLGGTNTGRAYSQIMNSLDQTDRDLMLRGKRVVIPYASMPPAMQNAAMTTTTSGVIYMKTPDLSEFKPMQLVISPLDGSAEELMGMGVGGVIALMGMPEGKTDGHYDSILGTGMPMSFFLLSKPDSMFGKLFAKMMIAAEEGAQDEEMEQMLEDTLDNDEYLAEAMAHDSRTEESPPTDPALLREVEMDEEIAEARRADKMSGNAIAVDALAKATGFGVMLESFSKLPNMADFIQPGKQPVYKLLIALEKCGYEWKLENRTLRIRPEDWAVRRSYDIPESFVAHWRDILEKQGYFSLDDLAAIAYGLTDDQICNTLLYDPDIGYAVNMWNRGDHGLSVLRLYATLSPGQKAAVFASGGLRFAGLSDMQWDYLATIIGDRLGGIYIADGSLSITNSQEDWAKTGMWTFKVAVIGENGNEQAIHLGIRCAPKEQLAPMIETRKKAREKEAQK